MGKSEQADFPPGTAEGEVLVTPYGDVLWDPSEVKPLKLPLIK